MVASEIIITIASSALGALIGYAYGYLDCRRER